MNRVLEELEDCASHRDVENEAEKKGPDPRGQFLSGHASEDNVQPVSVPVLVRVPRLGACGSVRHDTGKRIGISSPRPKKAEKVFEGKWL